MGRLRRTRRDGSRSYRSPRRRWLSARPERRGRVGRWAGVLALLALPSTLNAVQQLAAASPAAAQTATTTLYVASIGSDTANNCQTPSKPCKTIQYAVTQAEVATGAVTIDVLPGTYGEQVTVTPTVGSPMTSLTITADGGIVTLDPPSVTGNVTEGSTGQFFDDNAGLVSAIIGVDTWHNSNKATVDLKGLTVDGSSLTSTGKFAGIAFVDTSGALSNNTVENIERLASFGNASVHGIDVKSTNAPSTVALVGNTAKSEAGHVALDLMGGAPGSLSVTATGNILTGDPTTLTSPVAQFGIAAGGLTSLDLSGNTITGDQSPWGVSAIWLDPQAPGAKCTVHANTLTADDSGVNLEGASHCSVTDNTITAGVFGIAAGPSYYVSPIVAASYNTIDSNAITGTATEATTATMDYSTTPATGVSAVAGEPIDGLIVWDGQSNTMEDNIVGGFVADVYVGEDPVYLNNTASWGTTSAPPYDNSGNVVEADSLASLATPAAGSNVKAYGVANLHNTTSFTLDATYDWWGCAGGPGSTGCTPTGGSVNPTPWLATLAVSGPAAAAGGSPVTVKAALVDNTKTVVTAAATTPLKVEFSTSPNVASAREPLVAGTASFGFTLPGAGQTVSVVATLDFGPSSTVASTLTGETSIAAKEASTTSVSVAPSPAEYGQSVTYSATVSGAGGEPTPQGTVAFSIGSTHLCTATLSSGTGSCAASNAPSGTDTVTGAYSGDASFAPSSGTATLVVEAAPATCQPAFGKGYWVAGKDGEVLGFGDAHFYGSLPGQGIHVTDIVGIAGTSNGGGYWLVGADGGVFSFGNAGYYGSLPGEKVSLDDIVGIVVTL